MMDEPIRQARDNSIFTDPRARRCARNACGRLFIEGEGYGPYCDSYCAKKSGYGIKWTPEDWKQDAELWGGRKGAEE